MIVTGAASPALLFYPRWRIAGHHSSSVEPAKFISSYEDWCESNTLLLDEQ
jgi:hypothetical protein